MWRHLGVGVHKAWITWLPALLSSHVVLIYVFAREKCLLPLQLALESKNVKLAQHALAGIQVWLWVQQDDRNWQTTLALKEQIVNILNTSCLKTQTKIWLNWVITREDNRIFLYLPAFLCVQHYLAKHWLFRHWLMETQLSPHRNEMVCVTPNF